jgi:hypothetical protein
LDGFRPTNAAACLPLSNWVASPNHARMMGAMVAPIPGQRGQQVVVVPGGTPQLVGVACGAVDACVGGGDVVE